MSGGRYNYTYFTIEEEYAGKMFDAELDALIRDLVTVLKAVEWWQSGDTCEEDYRKTVQEFKDKWFGKEVRMKRLEEIVCDKCDELKMELLKMIGVCNGTPDSES